MIDEGVTGWKVATKALISGGPPAESDIFNNVESKTGDGKKEESIDNDSSNGRPMRENEMKWWRENDNKNKYFLSPDFRVD